MVFQDDSVLPKTKTMTRAQYSSSEGMDLVLYPLV